MLTHLRCVVVELVVPHSVLLSRQMGRAGGFYKPRCYCSMNALQRTRSRSQNECNKTPHAQHASGWRRSVDPILGTLGQVLGMIKLVLGMIALVLGMIELVLGMIFMIELVLAQLQMPNDSPEVVAGCSSGGRGGGGGGRGGRGGRGEGFIAADLASAGDGDRGEGSLRAEPLSLPSIIQFLSLLPPPPPPFFLTQFLSALAPPHPLFNKKI